MGPCFRWDDGGGCDKFDTTGKSLLIFRNHVNPPKKKYSDCRAGQITGITPAPPAHTRGASRSSRNVGLGLRWTPWRQAFLAPDENAEAYGQVVWSWRRDAGAKLAELSADDGDNKPAHRGEHEISRKAIAQGMSECFRSPVCSCASTMRTFGTRDRGCSVHPAFPAPSDLRGANELCKSSGETRREIANVHPLLPSSLRKQGPIRRGGDCENKMVDGFASTTTAWGYGSLLSQGRQSPLTAESS
jgi:hypothetical protein